MKNQKFKAFVVRDKNKSGIESMDLDELMPGNVLVKVKYSSLNYKDGLAVLNKSPIIRRHPMIPGSDFAGIVVKSDYKRFKKGDKVLCNGWGIGEKHFGGFAEYARVDGKWLIHLPNKFTLEQSMIIGAAGYTASLCVQELKKKVSPSKGEVIVTGASGGVGSIAVNLLSNLGYNVIAFSGKNFDYLKKLGAKKVIDPKEYRYSKKPLSRELWSGLIDTVGGDVLSSFLTEIKYNGIAVSTGLAKSHELNTTVFPFILRNITLAGIDCVYAPYIKRVNAWKFLEKNLDKKILKNIQTSKDLNKIKEICTKIINRQVMGRILIKI